MTVHKANVVKEKLQQQGIKCLFNVPYSPDFNPTEGCLSKIKGIYKREKLKHIVKNESIDYEKLIKDSIKCIEKNDIINYV